MGKMKIIYKVCGGNWGGTNVDETFFDFLKNIFGSEVQSRLTNECRSEYLEFLRVFEIKKRTVDNNVEKNVNLVVPQSFINILLKKSDSTMEDNIKESPHGRTVLLMGNKLKIDHSAFFAFYKKSIDNIISHLQGIFNEDCCRDLVGVVMVGGFAESSIVNSAIKKAFPDKKFIIPMEAGLAVTKGAVLYGHEPDLICSRICRYTYGTTIAESFDESIHPISRLILIEGRPYCSDVFQKFFTIGQVVSLGEAIELTSIQSFVDEWNKPNRRKPISVSVYVSDKESPKYVDDKGCHLLGNIEVMCDKGVWPERVQIKTKMEIAGTEIKVTSKMNTGEEVSATFDFL
ncbi:heat shock 70 kDa protein 12A-like [Saccostrea echinata]|uniref:heat shock 70 kDa protein 12A-like n=1 Tax=Saccostrea echinata TaxID=191078 RepID=UPI002A7EADA5|nr:heat shock 70 kDa protein 12A-like [Saccostrea echinata]